MSLYFGKAYQDLARSLMIEPRQVHAQSYLIEILMNLNQGEEVERLLKNALAYRPESLTARWYYLTTLLPRWGGSIDKMAAFVQSTRPYYKRNAALKVLDGRIAAEFGDQSYFAGNYARAFQFYTDALKTGDHWYYNNKRAEVLFSMAKYQAAIDDFSKAIEQRPTYWRSYDQRGVIYYVTGLHDEAIRDLTVAIDHREGGARVLNVRGKSYLALKEYLKALGDFEEAVMLDPNDTDYQANRDRAKAYLHAN